MPKQAEYSLNKKFVKLFEGSSVYTDGKSQFAEVFMKKLKRMKNVGKTGLGIAILLEIVGVLVKSRTLSILAFALLACLIVLYLIFYKCPYCGKFLGGRYGDNIKEKHGQHICPHCSHSLD